MKRYGRPIRSFATGGLVIFAIATPLSAQNANGLIPMYELIELKVEGGGQSRAYALNDTGQVIGWVQVEDTRHSAHWHNRVTTDLHGTVHFELEHPYTLMRLFSEGYGESYDISNADQIVGTARTEIECFDELILITNAFVLRPAVLTDLATPYPGDALTNLGTLGHACYSPDSGAVGISNNTHVVGWADRENGVIRAFLLTPVDGQFYRDTAPVDGVNDLMIDLGTLGASDPVSSATAVNDGGQVTGYSYTVTSAATAAYHAFLVNPVDTNGDGFADLWFTGAGGVNTLMTDVGTLGGPNSWGRDINNSGQVVGESDVDLATGEHYTHAFLYGGGTISDLGTLGDDRSHGHSAASAINDKGVVVGWAENEDRERRAFIWENGEMKDLNELLYLLNEEGTTIVPGVTLTEARDINEDGVIVGWGTVRGTRGTQTRGFLLNPILVDPSVFEEEEEEDGTDSGTDTGATGGKDYSGEPVFGIPAHLLSGQGEDQDGDETSGPVPPPLLCGVGTLTFLPLTLAALCWLPLTRRRARQGSRAGNRRSVRPPCLTFCRRKQ